MVNKEKLTQQIDGRAELLLGDIKTPSQGLSPAFQKTLLSDSSRSMSISTLQPVLPCVALDGPSEFYLPAISMYFDDVTFYFANRWCGELRAIDEFNHDHELRKIDHDRGLLRRAIEAPALWYHHMYVAHILDHQFRSRPVERQAMDLEDHINFMRNFNML